MTLKTCLRKTLILLMAGTICTLLSGILQFSWLPSTPTYPPKIPPINVPYNSAYLSMFLRGFPFPWVSFWEIDYYQGIWNWSPPIRTIDLWTFNSLNFVEDVLLYSLLAFLLSLYVNWRKKPRYFQDSLSSLIFLHLKLE